MKRPIPGTQPVHGREYLYIEYESGDAFSVCFPTIAGWGDVPLPKSGGAINEAAEISIPEGSSFFGVSYKGDLDGWRRKLVRFAEDQGLRWGRIDSERLVLSSGEELPLGVCEVTLD